MLRIYKKESFTLIFAGIILFLSSGGAAANWKILHKDELLRALETVNEMGMSMASRVNGVQVIAFDSASVENDPLIMVGRLAAWKDQDQRWALSSGKPTDNEKQEGAFETGAYRELREEFGIIEEWGKKTSRVLVNDAGKFGVKLVFFFGLDRRAFNQDETEKIITEELKFSGQEAPEYIEWEFMPFTTFRAELTGTEATKFNWRKFDKNMFGTHEVMVLVEAAIFEQ